MAAKKQAQPVSSTQLRDLAAELADISSGLQVLSLAAAMRARTRLDEVVAGLQKTADSIDSSAPAAPADAPPAAASE